MLRAAPENNDDDVRAFCARVVEEGVEAAAMQPDQTVHGVSLLLSLLPPSGSAVRDACASTAAADEVLFH